MEETMAWNISAHVVSLKGQDDIYVHTTDNESYFLAVLDGHGSNREVVNYALARLPDIHHLHLVDLIATLSTETNHMRSGACISLARLHVDGRIHVASLGDSPILWGPNEFQSIRDLYGLPPHGVSCNIHERTRIMISGGTTRGKYILSEDRSRMLAVTRSLGDSGFLPLILREPEYTEAQLSKGDFLLLCTDGFCDIQLPLSKMQIDWHVGVAAGYDAKQLIEQHISVHGVYDDTSVIVAYRY
jgi:serine/threonine protein phosphatase PrpC